MMTLYSMFLEYLSQNQFGNSASSVLLTLSHQKWKQADDKVVDDRQQRQPLLSTFRSKQSQLTTSNHCNHV